MRTTVDNPNENSGHEAILRSYAGWQGRVPAVFLGGGLLVALAQVGWHVGLIRTRSRDGCFKAFRANHWLGATLFASLLLASWLA